MNKQIQKLSDTALNGDMVYYSVIPIGYVERFANLLIQECVDICLAQRDPQNLNYKPSEKFADAIKQHFGIY